MNTYLHFSHDRFALGTVLEPRNPTWIYECAANAPAKKSPGIFVTDVSARQASKWYTELWLRTPDGTNRARCCYIVEPLSAPIECSIPRGGRQYYVTGGVRIVGEIAIRILLELPDDEDRDLNDGSQRLDAIDREFAALKQLRGRISRKEFELRLEKRFVYREQACEDWPCYRDVEPRLNDIEYVRSSAELLSDAQVESLRKIAVEGTAEDFGRAFEDAVDLAEREGLR